MGTSLNSLYGYYGSYYSAYSYSYWGSTYGDYYSYSYGSTSLRAAAYWYEFQGYYSRYPNYYRDYYYGANKSAQYKASPNVLISATSTKVKIKVPGNEGMRLVIEGTGLTTDAKGYLTGGTVTKMHFFEASTGKGTKFEFLFPVSATQLVADAKAGSGKFSPSNYKDFFDDISPTFLYGTGSSTHDVLSGWTGADQFKGKGGNDMLFMGKGNDFFDAGSGRDVVNAVDVNGRVMADLGAQTFTWSKGTTTGSSIENFLGSAKDDTIKGNGKSNILGGGPGDDTIKGKGGNDIIAGDKGNDIVSGNSGKDKFMFRPNWGKDKITDFQNGKDMIVLKGFGFSNKAQALSKFFEIGGKNDDKVGFNYKGTEIVIKGVDLKDIDKADIVI